MDRDDEILRSLGRIEGEFASMREVAERVRKLEMWQAWLNGAWAVLMAAYYLCKAIH